MNPDHLFQFVNTFVLPFWLLLLIYPKWNHRNTAIYTAITLLASIYAYYIITGPPMDMESFSTLEGIVSLFGQPQAVLIGWIHYLAFDLLVGNWVVNQAKEIGIKHIWTIPCIIFCFMLGPVGYLLFTILKISKVGRVN